MPQRRDPEQRSATTQPQPGQAPAKPTGDEIYRPQAAAQEARAEGEITEEEMVELEELRQAAFDAYERFGEAAAQFGDRMGEAYDTGRAFVRDNPASTVAGAFAVGIVLGMLSNGR